MWQAAPAARLSAGLHVSFFGRAVLLMWRVTRAARLFVWTTLCHSASVVGAELPAKPAAPWGRDHSLSCGAVTENPQNAMRLVAFAKIVTSHSHFTGVINGDCADANNGPSSPRRLRL